MSQQDKIKVLFLCTHNSARSQIAEGLLRQLGKDRFISFSAGSEATFIRPLAIEIMKEIDIDITGQHSKVLTEYLELPFDYVITVCDQANESCPIFPRATNRLHWSFPDPSRASGSHEEQLGIYRQVRESIAEKLQNWLKSLEFDLSASSRN